MHTARKAGVAIQIAAVLWSGILAFAALWISVRGRMLFPIPTFGACAASVALFGSGQFVYMTLFADRLFPHVHPGLRLGAELISFLMFVVGAALAAVYFLRAW